ncbi:MAG: OmpA family protein [Nitrospiraceae bacterium]
MLKTRSLVMLSMAVAVAGCSTCPPRTDQAVWVRPAAGVAAGAPVSAVDRDRQALASSLDQEKARASRLEQDLADARQKAAAGDTHAAHLSDLERQLADRDRELSSLRSQLAGTASAAELARLRQELADKEQETSSLRSQLANAANPDDLARARQDAAAKEQELAALRNKLAGAASADELANAKERAAAQQRDLAALQSKLAASASASDLERARQDVLAREQELARLKQQLGQMASAEELAAAKARIAELERELAARNDELARLKGSLTEEQQNAARLRGDLAAQMEKLKEAQRGIAKALRKEVEKGAIHVDMRPDHLLVSLTSGLLFESGADQLKPAGSEALTSVGGILKDYPEYAVDISGHTDNVAIKGELAKKFASNKELSAARAQSALAALQHGGMSNSHTTNGYADRKPVASNATADGRAKNRRVEVKVMPK